MSNSSPPPFRLPPPLHSLTEQPQPEPGEPVLGLRRLSVLCLVATIVIGWTTALVGAHYTDRKLEEARQYVAAGKSGRVKFDPRVAQQMLDDHVVAERTYYWLYLATYAFLSVTVLVRLMCWPAMRREGVVWPFWIGVAMCSVVALVMSGDLREIHKFHREHGLMTREDELSHQR